LKKINFKVLRSFVLVSFLVGSPAAVVVAQSYEIGGGLGTAVYSGDIIRKIDANQSGFQGTLFGKRNFDNVWSLRMGVNRAKITGADAIMPIDAVASLRKGYFRGSITEISALMEFNFLDYVNHKSEFRFSPYTFFGLGYTFFRGEGRINGDKGEENYKDNTIVIPFGGGVKYMLSEQLTLSLELSFRPTTSDGLDKNEDDLTVVPRSPTVAGSINFGNPNTKDWYYFLGLTVSYTLNKARCYTY
jgi:opacity protein-like surface antigen